MLDGKITMIEEKCYSPSLASGLASGISGCAASVWLAPYVDYVAKEKGRYRSWGPTV